MSFPVNVALAVGLWSGAASAQTDPLSLASDGRVLPELTSAWYLFPPYQYIDTSSSGTVTGIDVRFAQEFARRLGYFIDYRYRSWAEQIADIENGSLDFVTGATETAERSAFAYFTTPYRTEDVVLLVPPERAPSLAGLSTEQIMERFKAEGMRLGVIRGFVYGSAALNAYVRENSGTDLVVPIETTVPNVRNLLTGAVDGILEDRLTAIDVIGREDAFARVIEVPIDSHSDIRLMFSKANFTPGLIEQANEVIAEMDRTGLIENIRRSFLVPLFIGQTTDSSWYWVVDLLGTVAFALSGTILGWRVGANVAGFFVLSALPAIGGGIMRDIILGRPIAAFANAQNILVIAAISVCGYGVYRLVKHLHGTKSVNATFASLFNLFDAVGLGSFTCTGVAVTLSEPTRYSAVWAPFIGVLTAAGGGIVRDTMVQRRSHTLFDDFYAQISLLWGTVLTAYIVTTPARIEPEQYRNAILATVAVIILTRLAWLHYKGNLVHV